MKPLIPALMVVMLMLGCGPLQAAVTLESFTFAQEQEEQRFKDLIAEIRCLVCQNQSLLDSDAELAHDLRDEVYKMMQSGQSDDEITDFLVERYGDFVLYSPPVKRSTYFLWFGPFVLLAIAALLLLRAVRRQSHTPEPEFSAEDRKRLDKMLGKSAQQDAGKDS